MERIAYPISEAFQMLGLSRTEGYRRIADNSLQTYKEGRKRLATRRAIEAYATARERASQSGRAA